MLTAKENMFDRTTDDKRRYIKSWDRHVDELNSLEYPLYSAPEGTEIAELNEIKKRLKELIRAAANVDFD